MIEFKRQPDADSCKQKVKTYLWSEGRLTTTEISYATGIPQKTLCFLMRRMEVYGQVKRVQRRACRLTGRRAWEWTLN